MDEEHIEFIEALRGLSAAVHSLHNQALETKASMSSLLNESHLRSALTMLREDIFFKQLITKSI